MFFDNEYEDEHEMEFEKNCKKEYCQNKPSTGCPQLPGTLVRINIPAGAVINLLNLIEVTSPSGICLIVRLPFIGGSEKSILDTIRKAGGSVEFLK